jgi:glycosyltransferase involved in cell wall biosynthesis
MLRRLCREHEFTVFAIEFENPCPENIRWIRVPAPTRPLALMFLIYHLLAPFYYWAHRLRRGPRFDLVQHADSSLAFGDISYLHLCHRFFLKHYFRQCGVYGLRRVAYWLNYRLHALAEPWTLRRARWVVVPSTGLARRLEAEYPFVTGRIVRISNPVDIERMRPPETFDRVRARLDLSLGPDDVVLVFVALGNFEHKGLPHAFEALPRLAEPRLKLVVVGGQPDVVSAYRDKAHKLGIGGQVVLVGMQADVRRYLWLADAFIFPSLHETFPLVSLEAAAAGLPLIVTPVSGVDEFARHGENAFLVEYSAGAVAEGVARFFALPIEKRKEMGKQAQCDVARFSTENFTTAWRDFYASTRREKARAVASR